MFVDPDGKEPYGCCDPPTEEDIIYAATKEVQAFVANTISVVDQFFVEAKETLVATLGLGASVETSITTKVSTNLENVIKDLRPNDDGSVIYSNTPWVKVEPKQSMKAVEKVKVTVPINPRVKAEGSVKLETEMGSGVYTTTGEVLIKPETGKLFDVALFGSVKFSDSDSDIQIGVQIERSRKQGKTEVKGRIRFGFELN